MDSLLRRGDAWIDVVNPATEAVISRIPDGQAEDARKAIDAAERAQPEWEALPAIERASWLRKISAGIRERASEISALIVEEGARSSSWLKSKWLYCRLYRLHGGVGTALRGRDYSKRSSRENILCLNVRLV